VLTIGPAALVLTQLAYHAGPLTACLPPMTIADPVVSIIIGAVVFDEQLTHNLPAIAGQTLGFLLMSAAIIQLARHAAHPGPQHDGPAADSTGGNEHTPCLLNT
jgi:hypothetical protein